MKLCLFSSYSEKNTIDNYIKYYVKELNLHFDKIIFITNHRQIDSEDVKFFQAVWIVFTTRERIRTYVSSKKDWTGYQHNTLV